ncbi:hypothetical protein BDV98DRAFT_643122 [Pterulicium gracile]|uniref:Uncharacterized protein n=1 Tax=Pterulicium gracile TaxID=1884261 RepID=A0A5C3Q2P7_9AGAR|nr:hypothetical protein BDV98DRAFT_643122 [Pterula gracilis]
MSHMELSSITFLVVSPDALVHLPPSAIGPAITVKFIVHHEPGPSWPSPPSPIPEPEESPSGPSSPIPDNVVPSEPAGQRVKREDHPDMTAIPFNGDGEQLPPGSLPPGSLPEERGPVDFGPFSNRSTFEIADFLYRDAQMPGKKIKKLLDVWAANTLASGGVPPFASKTELYKLIDAFADGTAPWRLFTVRYTGPKPTTGPVPEWMNSKHEVWYRNSLQLLKSMLDNPEFNGHFELVPYKGVRRSWKETSEILQEHPELAGSLIVPTVCGSDKTTVSVMTGDSSFWPMYLSAGNLDNETRRAHLDSVLPVAFLAIPKSARRFDKDEKFLIFRRQLFHSSLAAILHPLRKLMTKGEILRCPDGHYRRVVFCIGPYIADYPEQVLLACTVYFWCPKCFNHPNNLDDPGFTLRTEKKINELLDNEDPRVLRFSHGIVVDAVPFTHSFPFTNIHELITPDILHQLIKGAFKDHFVDWIFLYLKHYHGEAMANQIMDDIDQRIAIVPSFPGLRRFPKGRRFKQWTGDDSKALMKVILPALEHWLPGEVVRCFASLIKFCYLARRSVITEDNLTKMLSLLEDLHYHCKVLLLPGVRDDFNLPRQHALMHYIDYIRFFAKHIKAVKEPWRRSNRWKALVQMLIINARLAKLTFFRAKLTAAGMLEGTILDWAYHLHAKENTACNDSSVSSEDDTDYDGHQLINPVRAAASLHSQSQALHNQEEDDDGGPMGGQRVMGTMKLAHTPARGYPSSVHALAEHTGYFDLPRLIKVLLWDRLWAVLHNKAMPCDFDPLEDCKTLRVFHSAVASFYAPSDYCGIGGMRTERIRSTPNWRGEGPRRDCVFAELDSESADNGFRGMTVLPVMLFFSFEFKGHVFPCALVEWFSPVGTGPHPDSGMWLVKADKNQRSGLRDHTVVHLDVLLRA